jgi:ribosome-binding factor A
MHGLNIFRGSFYRSNRYAFVSLIIRINAPIAFQQRLYQEWKRSNDPMQKFSNVKNSIGRASSILDDRSGADSTFGRSVQPYKQRGKLTKPLVKAPKAMLDPSSQGILQAHGNDIMDVINEALASREFYSLFRSVKDPSDVLEISQVTLNRDLSHAYIHWRSPPIDELLSRLVSKIPTKQEVDRMEKILKQLTTKLQDNEGSFRSVMIRKLNFRRVPRFYFKPDVNTQMIFEQLREIQDDD